MSNFNTSENQLINKPTTGYNIISHFIGWYFSDGPKLFLQMIIAVLIRTIDNFSLEYLLKTLFAPWKRDIVGGVNLSIQQKFQIWSWNLVSRFMGFAIRSITIIVGAVFITCFALTLFSLYIFWFIMPVAILALVALGIMALLGI